LYLCSFVENLGFFSTGFLIASVFGTLFIMRHVEAISDQALLLTIFGIVAVGCSTAVFVGSKLF
jgi:hypothetical protein